MEERRYFGKDFIAAVVAAGARARIETRKARVPAFYWDFERNLDVMERPNGKKYEIRFIAGLRCERNHEGICELDETVA